MLKLIYYLIFKKIHQSDVRVLITSQDLYHFLKMCPNYIKII